MLILRSSLYGRLRKKKCQKSLYWDSKIHQLKSGLNFGSLAAIFDIYRGFGGLVFEISGADVYIWTESVQACLVETEPKDAPRINLTDFLASRKNHYVRYKQIQR